MIDTAKIEQAMVQASDRTARRMTTSLRRSAMESGWPASVARHLSVRHADGNFRVHYPDAVSSDVDVLEYGTQTTPPSAVIRRFENRLDEHGSDFEKILSRSLRGVI